MKQVFALFGLLSALTFAGPSLAYAPPPEDDDADVIELFDVNEERADRIAEEFSSEDPTCPNYDQRHQIVIPVTQDELLIGYAFITPRFCFARGVNRFQTDDRMHFIFDSMVRAAHRTPFIRVGDDSFDKSATNQALFDAASAILGEGRLERVDLLGSDVRYLR